MPFLFRQLKHTHWSLTNCDDSPFGVRGASVPDRCNCPLPMSIHCSQLSHITLDPGAVIHNASPSALWLLMFFRSTVLSKFIFVPFSRTRAPLPFIDDRFGSEVLCGSRDGGTDGACEWEAPFCAPLDAFDAPEADSLTCLSTSSTIFLTTSMLEPGTAFRIVSGFSNMMFLSCASFSFRALASILESCCINLSFHACLVASGDAFWSLAAAAFAAAAAPGELLLAAFAAAWGGASVSVSDPPEPPSEEDDDDSLSESSELPPSPSLAGEAVEAAAPALPPAALPALAPLLAEASPLLLVAADAPAAAAEPAEGEEPSSFRFAFEDLLFLTSASAV
mmetsp:Transcript_65256/g.155901  ORF Transcript_65256/g.155901 Transcript_65256/m.155901 type:complete len:336 (-) Transcript_65256:800-1807(-)